MRARALLKSEYHGREVMRVNLRGSGRIDCDTKVARLAAEIGADYWEVTYNSYWADILAYRLIAGKNGIRWQRTYKQ